MSLGFALGTKHKCPKCGLEYWEDALKPLWICLKCGRIYQKEKEAQDCECLKNGEVKNLGILKKNSEKNIQRNDLDARQRVL